MPWKVGKKTRRGWPIIRSDTGEIVGYSATQKKAWAAVRARYANTEEEDLKRFNRRKK